MRFVARIALVAGAAGSLGLMFRVGARQNSLLLIVLFTGWVVSPFVALALAELASTRWSGLTRATLHGLMVVLAAGSVAIYADVAFGPSRPQPAFMFLMVPFGSWLLLTTVVPIAALVSRRRSG
jgi:ACR3 family arsenite efflux pump ArsB